MALVTAVVGVRSLSQEFPHAAGIAKKKLPRFIKSQMPPIMSCIFSLNRAKNEEQQ